MKRKILLGLVVVAFAGFAFGNTNMVKTADFSNPDPKGIVAYPN